MSPYPATSPYIIAPRLIADFKLSRTKIPAPSLITKPFSVSLKGLEALSTGLLSRAVNPANIPKASIVTCASEPPTITMSNSPSFTFRIPSMIASLPVAQAAEV